MSEDTNTNVTASETSANASETAPKRKRVAKTTFSVQDLAKARLRSRGITSNDRVSDECKTVRDILRSNFEFVRKNDASVKKAKDVYNDRKPWPTNMNKHTFDVVVNGKRAKKS